MKQVLLKGATLEALEKTAHKNFRTVELQIAYWLSQEGHHTETDLKPARVRTVAKKKVSGWSPEKRAAQAAKMKAMWEKGLLKPKTAPELDQAANGHYDD